LLFINNFNILNIPVGLWIFEAFFIYGHPLTVKSYYGILALGYVVCFNRFMKKLANEVS